MKVPVILPILLEKYLAVSEDSRRKTFSYQVLKIIHLNDLKQIFFFQIKLQSKTSA
jgi:hypothetical protein